MINTQLPTLRVPLLSTLLLPIQCYCNVVIVIGQDDHMTTVHLKRNFILKLKGVKLWTYIFSRFKLIKN